MRILITALLMTVQAASSQAPPAYLFSYFVGNGEDGLHLAASRDGLTWTALNEGRSFLTPAVGSKLMRDPSIVRGPDGVFHMVWTTGWWDKGIGIAHSKDLLTWSEQKFVPVMGQEPNAQNCWAPEIFHDADRSRYLIYWATTIPGRFPATEPPGEGLSRGDKLNHRMYYVETRDFVTYSDTKLLYDGGFSVIDAFIVKAAPDRNVMIVKDETARPKPKKQLRVVEAKRPDGPWGAASEPVSVDWVEGPSVLKAGDAWLVYYDEYTRKKYGAIRTRDFKSFETVNVTFPPGTRHGTAFPVPPSVAERLR